MNVNVFASGSSGNCVVINDDIIIDAGAYCPVVGSALLLTHNHTDHTKEIKRYAGLPIYTSQDVADRLSQKFPYITFSVIHPEQTYEIKGVHGSYYVKPIQLEHDVPCIGFDIVHGDERILYATDFASIQSDVDLSVYTQLFLECNNTLLPSDIMDVLITDDKPRDEFHRRKSYYNHCNIGYLIGLFERNGYTEQNRCEIPLTLLHKSSYYYLAHSERLIELCKIANVQNPLMELVRNGGKNVCYNLNESK